MSEEHVELVQIQFWMYYLSDLKAKFYAIKMWELYPGSSQKEQNIINRCNSIKNRVDLLDNRFSHFEPPEED